MARRRSSIQGDIKLRRLLRRINQTVDSQVRPAMQEGANLILETMQQLIPKDTGAAAAALTAFVSKSGLDAQIGIRGKKKNRDFFYLKFIERGTKGYTGSKRAGNRNRSKKVKSDGASFFGLYPDIPARPAHPFMGPAYQMNQDEVVALIRAAIASTLQRAADAS